MPHFLNTLTVVGVACVVAGAPPSVASASRSAAREPHAARAQASEARPRALESVARAFEASRGLDRASRLAALEGLDSSLTAALRGDLDASDRAAAIFLSGTLRFERGDFAGSEGAFQRAADADP